MSIFRQGGIHQVHFLGFLPVSISGYCHYTTKYQQCLNNVLTELHISPYWAHYDILSINFKTCYFCIYIYIPLDTSFSLSINDCTNLNKNWLICQNFIVMTQIIWQPISWAKGLSKLMFLITIINNLDNCGFLYKKFKATEYDFH